MPEAEGAFERNKLRNFIASSKLDGVDLTQDIDAHILQIVGTKGEENAKIAGTRAAQGLFVQHIEDRLDGLTEMASVTPDAIECMRIGVRMVLDTIDECNMQLLDEGGEPINPPHEVIDFGLVTYWDSHCADINS
jgi:hypothetical protein